MPHYADGTPARVGDEVLIRAHITEVVGREEYCNVTIETVEPVFPSSNKTWLSLSAKQLEPVRFAKVATPDASPTINISIASAPGIRIFLGPESISKASGGLIDDLVG